MVFGVTLTAGLVGLNAGQAAGGQVLAVGVLLAVAAGMLALELARVLAFVAGGVAAWVAVQTMLPGARELWAVFLAGGLLGLLLYRFWAMLLTSFAGAVLAGYAGLALCESLTGMNIVGFAANNSVALTGGILVATLIGVFAQHRISLLDVVEPVEENEVKKKKRKKKSKDLDEDEDEEDDEPRSGFWKRAVA